MAPAADPRFEPEGTASDNRAYFDFVNMALLRAAPDSNGRAIIDNLIAAGFEKSAMQVTPDRTAIGNEVDAIEFSVRIGGDCLIGQLGAAGYHSMLGPALGNGACLIGKTRDIDW